MALCILRVIFLFSSKSVWIVPIHGSDFEPIIEHRPEVLILGTGERQVFPDPAIFCTLMDLGIGFEVMDNAAACRTYNILIAEERRAVLALMLATDTA